MSKLVCLGELLIDFQSKGTGSLKDTSEFVKKAGGAPANVCVQATKLGVESVYLTQVGADGFGDFLIESLKAEGVDTSMIKQSKDYDTSLAFVSFKAGGEREFSFYRRTAADLHFSASDFDGCKFDRGDMFEFGSVALATEDARAAHKALIARAKASGAKVCFDPNLRLALWSDHEELKRVVNEFFALSDIIKIGDDELAFVTGKSEKDAVAQILGHGAEIVAVTRGSKGATLYLSSGEVIDNKGYKVNAVDTTGAGDSFFGGLLAELIDTQSSGKVNYADILAFACKCGSYTTTGYGAIAAMGDRDKIEKIGG